MAPPRPRAADAARADVQYRWRMEAPARMIVLVSAGLLAFGLAVLYSASAFDALNNPRLGSPTGTYYLLKQLTGAGIGAPFRPRAGLGQGPLRLA